MAQALRAESVIPAEAAEARVDTTFKPVVALAWLGGAILAFQIWVWVSWITGPYFVEVPSGPSVPPIWMQRVLITWTAVIMIGLPISVFYIIVKPWVKERRITTDGMLLVAMGLLFFQDPLLNYLNTWCTYNSWLWNRGSWVQDIPGWVSWGKPGAMMPEPLLMNAPGYSYGVLFCTMLGCWVMRKAKERWPNISVPGLLGVLIVFTFFFDIVMEGFFLMPMGLFTYPGAIRWLSLFPGTYHQYPIYQGLMWGAVQAGFCSLRFFTDDRGRTFAERGLEKVEGGRAKKEGIRFLAIFATISIFFFVFYNLPAQWLAMHADEWPEDIQKRSYFTMNVCGEGTGRLCPHPNLPIDQGTRSARIAPDGTVVWPEGVEIPKIIPFERPE